jgi:hypothetical protein
LALLSFSQRTLKTMEHEDNYSTHFESSEDESDITGSTLILERTLKTMEQEDNYSTDCESSEDESDITGSTLILDSKVLRALEGTKELLELKAIQDLPETLEKMEQDDYYSTDCESTEDESDITGSTLILDSKVLRALEGTKELLELKAIQDLPDPSDWPNPHCVAKKSKNNGKMRKRDLKSCQAANTHARDQELVTRLLALQVDSLKEHNLEPGIMCVCGKYQHSSVTNDSKSTELLKRTLELKLYIANKSVDIDFEGCKCLTPSNIKADRDDCTLAQKVARAPDPTLLPNPNRIKGWIQAAQEAQFQVALETFSNQMSFERSSVFTKKRIKLYKNTRYCTCCDLSSYICSTLLTWHYGIPEVCAVYGIKVPKRRQRQWDKHLELQKKTGEGVAKKTQKEQKEITEKIKITKAILKSLQPIKNKKSNITLCSCCGICCGVQQGFDDPEKNICHKHLCFFLTREFVEEVYESQLSFYQNKQIDRTPTHIKVICVLCHIVQLVF